MTIQVAPRLLRACALFILVAMSLLASVAQAERQWEDSYRAKLWPSSYSACLDGEALARIGAYQRANPTLRFRHRSLNVTEFLPDEESLCRYVIERSLGSRWVTVETGSRSNFATGSLDPCPMGARDSSGYCLPKSAGPPCAPCNSSNPINSGTGNKFQQEDDYAGAAHFPLLVQRYYNSLSRETGPFGRNWRHYYERRVLTTEVTLEAPSRVRLYRHDGKRYEFSLVSGAWVPDGGDVSFRLQPTDTTPIGWRVTTPDDEVEIYDFEGLLISITQRNGQRQTLTYDYSSSAAGGRLQRVTDQDGRALQFTYDANNRISAITVPSSSETIAYAYDSSARLTTVTRQDLTTRLYHYNETTNVGASLPTALTGITDESGTRFASFFYDAQGRAIRAERAGGAGRTAVAYTSNTVRTITDALGTARTFGYATRGSTLIVPTGLSQLCSHCGSPDTALLEYDANANVTLRRDFKGVDATFIYDTARNLQTSRTEAIGSGVQRTIGSQWHSSFRIPVQVDEPNRRTTFTHDANGNVLARTVTDLTVTPAASRTWTYTYSATGQALTEDGPRTDVPDVTTYAYYVCTTGTECGQIRTITNALGHTTTFNSYNAHGQPLTITDPKGTVSVLTYDSRQRLTSRTAAGELTTLTYWPTGLLRQITLPDSSFVVYTYDAAQRLTLIEDSDGNRVQYTLDALGNRTAETAYDPSGTIARTHSRLFNALNQLWKLVGAAGTNAVTTTYAYDGNGNPARVDAPLTRSNLSDYDPLNRVNQLTDPMGGITTLAYDARDNLTAVVDPRNLTTSFAYNGFNDLLEFVSPDTGISTRTHDSSGNLATVTDARGVTGVYSYDALNRISQMAYPDRTITVSYDNSATGTGQLTGASDANHSLAFTYDALGRLTGKGQTVGSVTKSIGYGYLNGNRASLVTPSGQTITYSYSNGRVSAVAVNGTPIVSGVLYEPFGPVSTWTWGDGTQAVRLRDADGKPTLIDSAGAHDYTYDDAFRITGILDSQDSSKSWAYGYDLLDRLTSASQTLRSIGINYDAGGNRLEQTGWRPALYTIATSSNRVTSIADGSGTHPYSHDAAGNTTAADGASFTYADNGRLISVTNAGVTTTYVIDALGRRIKKSSPTDTRYFVYDEGSQLIGEYAVDGTLIQETVWLNDVPIATLRPGSSGIEAFYIHTDHLDTPRRITQPGAGAVVWRWDSDPFGFDRVDEDPDGNGVVFSYPLRFPGQYADAESGLHYNILRDYDPAIGRYIESDPLGLQGGSYAYAYADDNPIIKYDLDGTTAAVAGVAIPIPGIRIPGPPPVVVAGTAGLAIGTAIYGVYGQDIVDYIYRFAKGKWTCTATCNVQQIDPKACCPERVSGSAGGPSEDEACRAAKRAATQSTPRGCYPRHCKCDCYKN